MATAHAKNRPPSAAKRWLPCPFSATVAPLYPNDETDASLKGDHWHKLMEDQITFGTLPLDCDPDAAEAMETLYAYVVERFKVAGPSARIFIEEQLDIPETGEFGTADIDLVCDQFIEIIDEKSGYVPVDVIHHGVPNEQLMTYLLGAIAKHGARPQYYLTIHQPNYDHIDGTLRTIEVTHADVEAHRARVVWSVANPDHHAAGPHCKGTYCDHRGACAVFHEYVQDDLALGWHPSELKGTDDATLAKALDAADQLNGYRQELRAEAMRRIMNMDRSIHGYKVVKGRRSRAVSDPKALVEAVGDQLGIEWARRLFPDLVWVPELPVTRAEVLAHLGTPKHIEDTLKQYARQHKLPNGGWKMLYDNVVGPYIRETASGLTLERAIDGRPAHKRGSEFGVLDPAKTSNGTTVL
jgi:hypothetical protein